MQHYMILCYNKYDVTNIFIIKFNSGRVDNNEYSKKISQIDSTQLIESNDKLHLLLISMRQCHGEN